LYDNKLKLIFFCETSLSAADDQRGRNFISGNSTLMYGGP